MLRAIARPLAALSLVSFACAAQAGTSGGVTSIIATHFHHDEITR